MVYLILFIIVFGCTAYLPSTQIEALVDIYNSLHGDDWTTCQWDLFYLSSNTTLPNKYCGLKIASSSSPPTTKQTIESLQFYSDYNLNGTLSTTMHQLTDLNSIILSHNPLLHGSLPDTICKIPSLSYISLTNIGLSGAFPECLGNTTQLHTLILKQMNATLTQNTLQRICEQGQYTLNTLTLTAIDYIGIIPHECGLMQTLQQLTLSSLLHLQGDLPRNIFSNRYLTRLIISYIPSLRLNQIPNTICNASYLQDLTLMYFDLNGTIPSCVGNLDRLVSLALLDLNVTMQHHTLRSICIHNSNTLRSLILNNIDYMGNIPMECGLVKHLQVLRLFSLPHLNGAFPDSFNQNISTLKSFELGFLPRLSGVFPVHMLANNIYLTDIQIQFMDQLQIKNVEESICTLKHLEVFVLSIYANTSSFYIPNCIRNATNLYQLNLASNGVYVRYQTGYVNLMIYVC
eukprot:803486_1